MNTKPVINYFYRMRNVIHQYFKKEIEGHLILVQIDPETFRGIELIITPDKKIKKTKRKFGEEIFMDLESDQFTNCSPLEFNLYLKGLGK